MIHGDAGIIHQYDINIKKGFNLLFKTIEKFIGKKGTILIPHFSYSFCEKKIFIKIQIKMSWVFLIKCLQKERILKELVTQFLVSYKRQKLELL